MMNILPDTRNGDDSRTNFGTTSTKVAKCFIVVATMAEIETASKSCYHSLCRCQFVAIQRDYYHSSKA